MQGSDHIERLMDDDRAVRRRAMSELVTAGDDAASTMVEYVSHPDWRVRRAGAIYADHHPLPEVMERLILTLHDPKAKVRAWAIHSLACEPCKPGGNPVDAVPAVIAALEGDKAARVRRTAAYMLGQQESQPRIVEALQRALAAETDTRAQNAMRWALGRLADQR